MPGGSLRPLREFAGWTGRDDPLSSPRLRTSGRTSGSSFRLFLRALAGWKGGNGPWSSPPGTVLVCLAVMTCMGSCAGSACREERARLAKRTAHIEHGKTHRRRGKAASGRTNPARSHTGLQVTGLVQRRLVWSRCASPTMNGTECWESKWRNQSGIQQYYLRRTLLEKDPTPEEPILLEKGTYPRGAARVSPSYFPPSCFLVVSTQMASSLATCSSQGLSVESVLSSGKTSRVSAQRATVHAVDGSSSRTFSQLGFGPIVSPRRRKKGCCGCILEAGWRQGCLGAFALPSCPVATLYSGRIPWEDDPRYIGEEDDEAWAGFCW